MILVPSNISKDNNYRKAIIDIGNENSINIIDPKEIMDLSGKKENTYLNGDLPNDIGYQIYTQAIEKAINEELSKR